jgi:hypothetical protein
MGYKLSEKISSTAAEGNLRRLDNETHMVTFSAGSLAPSRSLGQQVLRIPAEQNQAYIRGEEAAAPSSPNTPAELRMAAMQKAI